MGQDARSYGLKKIIFFSQKPEFLDDAESGMDDAESGIDDTESGMDDAESGMDDAESGMDDIKYKHCAQQTPQNYLQKFRFL
jgi:hypothetical protein